MSRARVLLSMGVLAAGALAPGVFAVPAARAFDSACVQSADATGEVGTYPRPGAGACAPSAGPNTARQRWIGGLDEHRQVWEVTRAQAGLPEAVSATVRLRVFTAATPVQVGGAQLPSLTPVPFEQAALVQTRAFSVGELAQLPDFSYGLWDWATGHESCPPGGSADPELCHDFASHMGPVNANHFPPQAAHFYSRYHALALGRAQACAAAGERLGAERDRFASYLRACELEALALEAVGQHFLQDAWSMGHMWQRWGGPDFADFQGTPEVQRARAVLTALVAGLIHGARGVLQRLPEWTSYDVNDAMGAPHPEVQYVLGGGGAPVPGIGDDYLQLLPLATATGTPYAPQAHGLLSCAASGMRAVYRASGEQHGALGALATGLVEVDPTGAACFGQRATNAALLKGAAIQFRVLGAQVDLPLDARLAARLIPQLGESTGQVTLDPALRNRFRFELQRVASLLRLLGKGRPGGTEAADGRLGAFLGAAPNGAYAGRTPLASYVDPDLPWPGTADAATPEAGGRALALARLFHRAHAEDWCARTFPDTLQALRARVTEVPSGQRAAACEACTEVVVRHLRVGSEAAWDTAREPLCQRLTSAPALVYQPGDAAQAPEALAAAWCGCSW
ncbi:MAG: hypothetical protein L0Y66_20700 [Myxococcaceae bacterium]|nr:hypothetical protein [Myxococcaceae bacterium]